MEAIEMSAVVYPVHVEGRLDPKLSRGLWLVKWLLVIPHYFVLAFLWVAFAVLSVVAFFAILFTGRYPRAIFEFNVGVLRWSWRVAYYAYGALGTDRYPPFSLRDDPSYPARLDVDYPAHLSRGLVLVKWWLLALPHYIVVGLLLGSGAWFASRSADNPGGPWVWSWGGGLIGLLALVAAVALLFTGRYPKPLFDLVLGLNRWVLRVAGYAALMTDEYPPFRLDQGGDDPGAGQLVLPLGDTPSGTSEAATVLRTTQPGSHAWTTGRVVTLVGGAVTLLLAIGLAGAGGVFAYADTGMRDGAGYVTSDPVHLSSSSYAVVSDNIELHAAAAVRSVPRDALGDARITVAAENGKAVFVGIAPTREVDTYLSGVAHSVVQSARPGHAAYETVEGGAPAARPADALTWAAQSAGTGTQTLVWPVATGDWSVVVMNADAAAGVSTTTAFAATLPMLDWMVPLMFGLAFVALLLSVALVVAALVSANHAVRRQQQIA
jgi:hypothetical protein